MAFLKRVTLPGSAVCCTSAAGSASCLKPGTGTKDAPRAFSLKFRKTARGFDPRPTSYDDELEAISNLLTAKHVDDINMAGLGTPSTSASSVSRTRLASVN
eukprot:6053916-Pyramimonas_sp.AAC.1